MKRVSLHVLPAVVVVLGCGPGARSPVASPEPAAAEASMPAGHDHAMMEQLPATSGPGFTVADVRFMQDMIGHHAQAVRMAALVPDRVRSEPVRLLAEKIDISQRDEIGFMRRWLRDRDQAVPDENRVHSMMMPGMLTPAQMAELEAASGTGFDRLFLSFMIQHHGGALVMVEDLFDSPGAGQDPDIFRFATDVDADQRDEIYIMQSMLAMLDDNDGRSEAR